MKINRVDPIAESIEQGLRSLRRQLSVMVLGSRPRNASRRPSRTLGSTLAEPSASRA